MSKARIYYATNRRHVARSSGSSRWRPDSYATDFSSDGMENLRFGKVTLDVDASVVREHLEADSGPGVGDGESLAGYLAELATDPDSSSIQAYREKLDSEFSDMNQPGSPVYGSRKMFADLQGLMARGHDVLVYIHGYNVDWYEAVGSAVALQEMLNREASKQTSVVLFTWPSDGSAMPFVAYKSDRADAQASGGAVGRAFLKLRDHLHGLHRDEHEACGQGLHLLTHSMGNYVLQCALDRIAEFSTGPALPRIFEHVFLCAADVDDSVLEPDQPMGRLAEITRNATVYFNTGDTALTVSDFTKGNPDRLGTAGAARPSLLHNKIHQVDCSPIVGGFVEHSYYLAGRVNADIAMGLASVPQESDGRSRSRSPVSRNAWVMR